MRRGGGGHLFVQELRGDVGLVIPDQRSVLDAEVLEDFHVLERLEGFTPELIDEVGLAFREGDVPRSHVGNSSPWLLQWFNPLEGTCL
jgi:hypothetical protein